MNFSSIKNNIFYDLLLFESPEVNSVSGQVVSLTKLFVGVFFVLGALWEFFSSNRYFDLVLRTLLCLILFASYESFLNESIKISFTTAEKILKQSSRNNPFVIGFKEARLTAKKKIRERELEQWKKRKNRGEARWWDKLLIMAKVYWNNTLTVIIWLLIYCVFLMLKILYTTTFYLLYVFVPIQALLCIFPPTQSSLKGAFDTYCTLVLVPFVITVLIIIFGNSMDYVTDISQYTISDSLRGLMQLLMSGILLLFAPIFTQSIINGQSTISTGAKVTKRAASAISTVSTFFLKMTKRAFKYAKARFKKIRSFKNKKKRKKGKSGKNTKTKPNKKGKTSLRQFEDMKARIKDREEEQKTSIPFLGKIKNKLKDRKLSKRAEHLIRSSHNDNVDLESYSTNEKIRAIEMAQENPKKNFIKRRTYFDVLDELSALDRSETEEKPKATKTKAKKIKKPKRKKVEKVKKSNRTKPTKPVKPVKPVKPKTKTSKTGEKTR